MIKIVSALTFACIVLLAEEKSLPQKMIEPRVSYESTYLGDANIVDSDGGVRVYKNQLQVNYDIFSLGYSHWKFDWDQLQSLPFGDALHTPLSQIHAFQAGVHHTQKIDDQWSYFTSLSLKSTFEKEMKDSFGINLLGFASYRLNNEHSIQIGGFANYHPTETLVLPALSYSYRERYKEGWQFVLGFPRTHVGYHIDEKTLMRLGMMFSQSLVRLSDESVIQRSGYVEAKDYLSNLGITYEFNKHFSLSTDLLYTIKREFIIYDSSANEVQNNTIKNALGANMRLVYRF